MTDLAADSATFGCIRCGLCCRKVSRNPIYRHLDRGDGVCRNLDEASNLCSIYEDRPDECRIDLMYDRHFASALSRQDFHAANWAACQVLITEAASTKGVTRCS